MSPQISAHIAKGCSPSFVTREVKTLQKQESISGGCEPSAYQPYMLHNEQVWTCPGGQGWRLVRASLYSEVPCLGGWGQKVTCVVRSNTSWVMVTWEPSPCAQNDWQTDTIENITFPQLRWWVVTRVTIFRRLYEFCSNVVFHTVFCFETLKIPAASQEKYRKVSTWNYRRTWDVERWVFVSLFWVVLTLVRFNICQF